MATQTSVRVDSTKYDKISTDNSIHFCRSVQTSSSNKKEDGDKQELSADHQQNVSLIEKKLKAKCTHIEIEYISPSQMRQPQNEIIGETT